MFTFFLFCIAPELAPVAFITLAVIDCFVCKGVKRLKRAQPAPRGKYHGFGKKHAARRTKPLTKQMLLAGK